MPKTYKTIHYSQLEYKELDFHPFKRVRGVCYYDGFWTLLAQDVLKSWHKGLKWLHRHYRKEFVLGSIFLLALIPAPHRVKAMSPLSTKPLYMQSVSHLEPLQPISIPVPQPVSPVPEPQPVAPPPPVVAPVNNAPSSCGDNYYANYIYMHESGCRTDAIGPNGPCGLGQALPCSKMGCSLSDYACQNQFFTNYAMSRYGSWAAAYAYWLANHNW